MPFEQSTQLLTQTPRFLQHLWSQVALSVCLKRKWPGQYIFFPNGSAGGPDGSRPQHLKDRLDHQQGLRALTSFINLILAGQTPEPVRPLFFGANLVALEKKGGGVRPITVGCTLRRLAAKAAAVHVKGPMHSFLATHQLGYGTPQGQRLQCMPFACSLTIYVPPDHVLLKLDFSNAFNCVRRDQMLICVRELVPELLPFVHSAYSATSTLFGGKPFYSHLKECNKGIPLTHCCSALLSIR